MDTYFTDRELGLRPRVSEVIDERVWLALRSLIEGRIEDGSFGFRFPEACEDSGREPYGTDASRFGHTLSAEVPYVTWPVGWHETPQTFVILDILEFCANAVGRPIRGRQHDYHRHTHISAWDRVEGLAAFVAEVNLILARNGIAFELTQEGQARRLMAAHLGQEILTANFATGDRETDWLLEEARRRFLAPKIDDRRDGLEKLWDAFERIKTLEPGGDKKVMAEAILNRAARPDSRLHQVLTEEALALTRIGNNHRIRHSETDQEPLETTAQVDFLFQRLFAFIHLLLASSGRLG